MEATPFTKHGINPKIASWKFSTLLLWMFFYLFWHQIMLYQNKQLQPLKKREFEIGRGEYGGIRPFYFQSRYQYPVITR